MKEAPAKEWLWTKKVQSGTQSKVCTSTSTVFRILSNSFGEKAQGFVFCFKLWQNKALMAKSTSHLSAPSRLSA